MLDIFIPSRSRSDVQKTIHNLSESLWPRITLVVPPEQHASYRLKVPKAITILVLDQLGITVNRQFILHQKSTGKIILMDDDLTFYKRSEDNKFSIATATDTESLVADIEFHLDIYPFVGVSDKYMSHLQPRIRNECHKFNDILSINRDLLPYPWPQFRIPHDEEHDFHLQLLTRGCKSCMLTEWAKSNIPRAPGGCSDWRNNEVLNQAHQMLVGYWPTIVSIKELPERNKVRYKWREAKRMGGII